MSFVLEDGENILPDSSDNEEELEITVSVPIKKNLVDAFNDAECNQENGTNINKDNDSATMITAQENKEVIQQSSSQKETMKVYLRVRPGSDVNQEDTVKEITSTTLVTRAPESSNRAKYTKTEERHYQFSRVFGPKSNQDEVFNNMVSPMMMRFLNGDSCVLFAYGMTNSGKTHTIQGTKDDPGVLPNLITTVMKNMENTEGWNLSISMLEVYQERVHDLLTRSKTHLPLRDINGRVDIPKLTSHEVSDTNAFKLMSKAAKNRTNSSTFLNKGSSRSHAIYTLTLNQIIDGREVSSIFQVVDLAGSERNSRTRATSAQQKEANNINTSLMQLWRCLSGMRRKNTDIIPFRESKLTHILMPLLGRAGLAGVSMLACMNPQANDYDESLSILSNASLACKIKEISDIENRAVNNSSSSNNIKTSLSAKQRHSSNSNKMKTSGKRSRSETTRTSSLISDVTMDSIPERSTSSEHSTDGMENYQNTEALDKAQLQIQDLSSKLAALEKELDISSRNHMSREAEIREEVSVEMAVRSEYLLENIKQLQEELSNQMSRDEVDITKSCKKMRKEHVSQADAETVKHLKEAEEELIRVSNQYESTIDKLKKNNCELQDEVKLLRNKIQKLEQSTNTNTSVKSPINDENAKITVNTKTVFTKIDNSTTKKEVAGETFSNRIKRDQRFKTSTSPKRSPLQVVKTSDENSPIRSSTKKSKLQQPSQPYLSRLRSQLANE